MVKAFENFLGELAVCLEFQTLKPDQHGACLIVMKDGGIPLLFEFDDRIVPGSILVSSPIGPSTPELLTQTLKHNSQVEETLSLHGEEHSLYLHRRLSSEITAPQLKVEIDHFLAQAKTWTNKAPKEALATVPPPSGQLMQSRYKA